MPGRQVTQNGITLTDSGPTSWQAVIEAPNDQSFREFLFEFQDSTLMYTSFAVASAHQSGLGVCSSDASRRRVSRR